MVLVAVGVALVLVGAYGIAYAYVGDRVAQGTTVAGVAIGGLTVADAEDRLRDELVPQLDSPIRVSVDDTTVRIVPSQAGLRVDVEATVAVAGGGSASPLRLARALFSRTVVAPRLETDTAALREALAPLARQLARAPRNGAVAFGADGRVVVTRAVQGRRLDTSVAAARVEQAWRAGLDRLSLPVRRTAPTVSAAEIRRVVDEVAAPAMSGPVRVVAGGRSASLGPGQLARALTFRAEKGRLTLAVDRAALRTVSRDVVRALTGPAVDATVRIENGRPVVVPSHPGRTISLAALAEALPAVAVRQGDARRIDLPTVARAPRLSTQRAAALGVKEVVGEFTTRFPYADYRNVNIGRAAALIDNTFLAPGEVFSLNDEVGERTAANGFTTGFVIDGGRLREDLGGGVSQLATTTFNAMWFAGLADVEHHPHAFWIDRYPMGREATVWWGGLDLRFRNDTKYGVVVQASVSPSAPGRQGVLTVRMWSTKHRTVTSWTSKPRGTRPVKTVDDAEDGCVPQQGVPGFDVDYGRTISEPGKPDRRESYTWAYQAADRIRCSAKPAG